MTTDFFFPPEMWKSKKKIFFHETAVPSTDTHYPLHYEFTELQQQGQSTAGLKDNLHSWEGHEHKLWLHSVYHSFGRGPQTQIQTRLQKVTCSNQCQCCYVGTGSFTPLPIAILWITFHFRVQFFNSTLILLFALHHHPQLTVAGVAHLLTVLSGWQAHLSVSYYIHIPMRFFLPGSKHWYHRSKPNYFH